MRAALIIAAFVAVLLLAIGLAVVGAKIAVKGGQIVSDGNQPTRGAFLRLLGTGLAIVGVLAVATILIVTISEAL